LEREIIAEVYPWESRIGIVEDGRLAEVFWADQNDNVGNIYKGRIKDIISGLSCVFIDIGQSKNAFLYKGDIVKYGLKKGSNILDVLASGQEMMVQIKKEAFAEKGARVTGNITIPGHYLVLVPFQNEVAISRKITSDKRREYLREIIEANKPENTGVIVRTACMEAADNEIITELKELQQLWIDINNRYETTRAPDLLYGDIDVLEKAMRDYFDVSISRIIVNNRKLKEKMENYISRKNASCKEIIYEEGNLFEKYSLEKDLKRALRRKVWLKSGGYLIIDQTEAMTVIDINSGKYTGKDDFAETIFRLNMEAAAEIPRQLRLRSIGGIILIDFVDMKSKEHQEEVINTLRSKLTEDKANTKIVGLTGLGFLEMTRKKSRYGISEFFSEECSGCNGRGRTINLNAISNEIKRKLVNMDYLENEEIICEGNAELIKILTEDKQNLDYIEKRIKKRIKLVTNSKYGHGDYNIYAGTY
jgi:ribonuclease G